MAIGLLGKNSYFTADGWASNTAAVTTLVNKKEEKKPLI